MINPKKFYQRSQLFNDILVEIFNVESNYRTELSILNLKLLKKIEEYKNNVSKKSKIDKIRQSFHIKSKFLDFKNLSLKPYSSDPKFNYNNSEDNSKIEVEENPFTDQIISEGLQYLLSFYKTKHKLISKEVSNLGIVLYNFSSQIKSNMNNEDFDVLVKNKTEFDTNYIKLEKAKDNYFDKMNELELYFHNNENVNNMNNINNNKNSNKVKEKKNSINNNIIMNEDENKKKKISELTEYRRIYKKSLDDINNSKRTYIAKINEISNEIQEFNINENNLLYNIFKIFNENLLSLLNEIDKSCELYENNKKIIEKLNIDFSNSLNFDNKIFINFQFEEYNPKYTDINNKKDLSVIQKMHKLIGFEFDKISNNNDDMNNKDNNALFIIIMDKFINEGKQLNEKEKKLLKNLFNQEKYIKEFLNKLNIIRINKKLFYNKDKFDILFELFTCIYSKVSFGDENKHDLVKLLMILSETFYYKIDNKKIFLNNELKMPPELKDIKFWIRYIELEIQIEYKKLNKNNKKNNNSKFEYIVLLSNITHLKENIVEKEKLKEIIKYFKDIYKFSNDDVEVINNQLKI